MQLEKHSADVENHFEKTNPNFSSLHYKTHSFSKHLLCHILFRCMSQYDVNCGAQGFKINTSLKSALARNIQGRWPWVSGLTCLETGSVFRNEGNATWMPVLVADMSFLQALFGGWDSECWEGNLKLNFIFLLSKSFTNSGNIKEIFFSKRILFYFFKKTYTFMHFM